MYDSNKLVLELDQLYNIKKNQLKFYEGTIDNDNVNLRDSLFRIGTITKECLAENVYLADIPVGFFSSTVANVALHVELKEIYIVAYAKEGIIKQHLADQAIQKILGAINE